MFRVSSPWAFAPGAYRFDDDPYCRYAVPLEDLMEELPPAAYAYPARPPYPLHRAAASVPSAYYRRPPAHVLAHARPYFIPTADPYADPYEAMYDALYGSSLPHEHHYQRSPAATPPFGKRPSPAAAYGTAVCDARSPRAMPSGIRPRAAASDGVAADAWDLLRRLRQQVQQAAAQKPTDKPAEKPVVDEPQQQEGGASVATPECEQDSDVDAAFDQMPVWYDPVSGLYFIGGAAPKASARQRSAACKPTEEASQRQQQQKHKMQQQQQKQAQQPREAPQRPGSPPQTTPPRSSALPKPQPASQQQPATPTRVLATTAAEGPARAAHAAVSAAATATATGATSASSGSPKAPTPPKTSATDTKAAPAAAGAAGNGSMTPSKAARTVQTWWRGWRLRRHAGALRQLSGAAAELRRAATAFYQYMGATAANLTSRQQAEVTEMAMRVLLTLDSSASQTQDSARSAIAPSGKALEPWLPPAETRVTPSSGSNQQWLPSGAQHRIRDLGATFSSLTSVDLSPLDHLTSLADLGDISLHPDPYGTAHHPSYGSTHHPSYGSTHAARVLQPPYMRLAALTCTEALRQYVGREPSSRKPYTSSSGSESDDSSSERRESGATGTEGGAGATVAGAGDGWLARRSR
ncbi:hypothetical protein TSOC_005886 [Tetrabaena socialis]|uniref:Uncharacterized protein n=1 Tax=Tetrabaena socialis TaxID=47790 RepID=A0A2J8A529_9CHLO|nr:hypothetical protein TSOC_005886 [Tetrabaena socialis]|eukprot:PNH07642.1 hypothetical protein TSOC_005886 [Tetrabaena socialis]